MIRLFLTSMFQKVGALLETVEPNLKGKSVTFIPTASKAEKLGFFVNIGKWKLRRLGLKVDVLDVAAVPYETIENTLEKNDVIYIAGGNTFYLLQELKRSGADKLIIQEVCKGKLYIGESAGAVAVSPDIGYSSAMDSTDKAPELTDYTGLNLVNFYTVPHLDNWEMGKAARNILGTYSSILDLKAIGDKQAILVNGDEIKLLEK